MSTGGEQSLTTDVTEVVCRQELITLAELLLLGTRPQKLESHFWKMKSTQPPIMPCRDVGSLQMLSDLT